MFVENRIQTQVLANSYQRAFGAMFKKSLEETILVFAYPFSKDRLFTTWFCPPLRILCFDDDGVKVFDQVIDQQKLVRLPKTRLVLEMDPAQDYENIIDCIQREGVDEWIGKYSSAKNSEAFGAGYRDDALDALIFGLVKSALRTLKDYSIDQLPPWKRGQILSSASLITEMQDVVPYDIPPTALKVSRIILERTPSREQDELLAASVAGLPWNLDAVCFQCGRPMEKWHPIFPVSERIDQTAQWRLERPENHLPLCKPCYRGYQHNLDKRIAAGYAFWGSRFSAFCQWYIHFEEGTLPENWDLNDYPLWPMEYGGDTWGSGSGAIKHCASTYEYALVERTAEHLEQARAVFKKYGMRWKGMSRQGKLFALLYGSGAQ